VNIYRNSSSIVFNPYNNVPTLVDRDLSLYDANIIAEYLDERFPHPPLMPVDPVGRATLKMLMSRIRNDWDPLVEKLVKDGMEVVALDNFSTGKKENIEPYLKDIEFVEGDIRDLELCKKLCRGCDYVLHQAALGSVPRSVEDPYGSNDNNVTGTLNMMIAARDAEVEKFVYAASSSAYGDTATLPKVETMQHDLELNILKATKSNVQWKSSPNPTLA